MKKIKKILLYLILPAITVGQDTSLQFTYTIPSGATHASAGVYNGDVLIRTLFSGKEVKPGAYTEKYKALDDYLQPIKSTFGLSVKVQSNNVKATWLGVIGNTSDSMTGNSVYHNYGPITDMVFVGNFCYYTLGYNERKASYGKFNIATPNQRIFSPFKYVSATHVASDGVNIYWGCGGSSNSFVFATKIIDDKDVTFTSGISFTPAGIGSTFSSAINVDTLRQDITGIAVQKTGRFLFVSRSDKLDILDKRTGATLGSISIEGISDLSTDDTNNLWAIVGNKIICYSGTTLLQINERELIEPCALANYAGNVVVLDRATSVISSYNANGLIWTLGRGDYSNDPTVYNDKFYVHDLRGNYQTFISYQTDGSFWVGDPGNTRAQHFSVTRDFINNIAYRPLSYSTFTDKNNPSRVFSDYCEYSVDYSKPIAQSWKLIKNWGYTITEDTDDKYGRLKNVITLSNGRTYALGADYSYRSQVAAQPVYELPENGNLRYAGLIADGFKYDLYENGNLRGVIGVAIGEPTIYYQRSLSGFDSLNNPIWDTIKETLVTPALTLLDPAPYNIKSRSEITSSNIFLAYDGGDANSLTGRGFGFHLAGFDSTGRKIFQTARATYVEYMGDFPEDGSFDVGNNGKRSGDSKHHAIGRYILYTQHGEFWKNSQVYRVNVFNDNGLLISHFGESGPDVSGLEAPPFMAGNSFTGNAIFINGDIYLTSNDEGRHSGVHLIKISNLSSISVQTVPVSIVITPKDAGNLMTGLPFNKPLANNIGGWVRSPLTDDSSATHTWLIRTNVKSFSRFDNPDIFVKYRFTTGKATLTKIFNTATVSAWSVTGKISLDNSYSNQDVSNIGPSGNGGQFLEILDANGRVLLRFFRQLNYTTKLMKIIANGVVLESGLQPTFEPHTRSFVDFTLKQSTAGFQFTYNGITKTIPLLDSKANKSTPKTIRLYFWTNTKNAERVVSIKDFKFTKQ